MSTELIPNSDMQVFSPADIKRAGELLRCPMDESSAIKALIIQRDTGLSLARGEISIVPFNGRPTVMINKQGYLAYAARQPNYDGYESGIETVDGETVAWCVVYDKNVNHPVKVRIYEKEYAKTTPIWKEKPRYMLEKTAISLALRAAFPILNGTYEDGEIEPDTVPFRVEPKSTDISVQPEPVTTVPPMQSPISPAQTTTSAPQKPVTDIYTQQQINDVVYPNYQSQGFDTTIFNRARLADGTYDKQMITDDFKRQLAAEKTSDKPAHTVQEPSATQDKPMIGQPYCVDCGNVRVFPEEEKASRDKYGVALCSSCMSKRIAADLKAKRENEETAELQRAGEDALSNLVSASSKQTKPTADGSSSVCSVCGRKMSKAEQSKWKLMNPGKPLVCDECATHKEN